MLRPTSTLHFNIQILLIVLLITAGSRLSIGQERLVDAAQHQQWDIITQRLQSQTLDQDALSQTQGDGMTALHWAAVHDHDSTVQALCQRGADVDQITQYGMTALLLAVENASVEIVQHLIDAGADVNKLGPGKESSLMLASRRGESEIVETLMLAGAQIDARQSNGNTALMWASAAGHSQIVKQLVDAKADINRSLSSGFTAFLFAVREGQIEAAQVLLEHGADVNATMDPKRTGGRHPRKGMSALLLAVESAHFELALKLVKQGADPNDQRSGYAPLHALTWVRKADRGDNVEGDPEPRGSGRVNSIDFAKALIEAGADVDLQLENGSSPGKCKLHRKGLTPLMLASRTADIELMNLLIEHGADPKLTNIDGCTTMMVAAGVGVVAVGEEAGTEDEVDRAIEILAALGVDPNSVDKNGETAMHGAAYRNYPSAVKTLAKVGAACKVWNKKNKHGWTPHDIASGKRPGSFKPSPPTTRALDNALKIAPRASQ